MKDPEEKEIMAYIAGLLDGDGSLGIKLGPRGKVCPIIQLHNSCKGMTEYLKKLFGGCISCDKPKKEGNRPVWRWMLQGTESCLNFLNKTKNYLIIKNDSAELIWEFLTSPVENKDYIELSKSLNLSRKLIDSNLDGLERLECQSPYFWAYVAGIMDTDGSFSIEKSIRKPKEGNRQVNDLIKYRPRILLTMVSDLAIKYILGNCSFGGYFTVVAKSALKGKACRFNISSRFDAIEFLKKCLPYLQFKTKQAVVLLNFCRNYQPTNGLAKVPEEEKQYRENCYNEIMMLNNTPS